MCFTHYESSSPFLSAKTEENEQNVLTDCAARALLTTEDA